MTKAKLTLPLRPLLDEKLPEGRVHRLWQRVETARVENRVFRANAWLFAILTAGVASVLVFWGVHQARPGALRLVDGRAVPVTMSAEVRSTVSLDDGSSLDVSAGGRLELLESTGQTFSLALRHGTTEFEVHPGGPRTWRIECAGVVVEVVGTHFTVERGRESLRVAVERGVVLVRGEAVPDRVVRLTAGQSIVVPLLGPSTTATANPLDTKVQQGDPASAAPAASHAASEQGKNVVTSEPSNVAAKPLPSAREADVSTTPVAENRAAFAVPETDATRPNMESLLTDADSLRRAGRFREAAALLERGLAEHAGDPRAALAEFSLGRLYLESLGSPAVAGEHFSHALELRLPAALEEDARARLVEADARAGNQAAADRAASDYRSRYPGGRRLADVNRWARSGF